MFKLAIFIFILSLIIEIVFSQCMRQPQYNYVNRPYAEYIETPRIMETPRIIEAPRLYEAPKIVEGPRIIEAPRIIETPRYIETPRLINPGTTVIAEPPCNSIVPLPSVPSSTTLITDCTPAVCKNLANTIQLMIVCGLLQNTKGGPEIAMSMASPILNEIMTSSTLSCGCSNPIATMASGITPNLLAPSITPGVQKMVGPTMIPPNVISTYPNSPPCNMAANNNFMNSLMTLLSGGM